jgi:hypothetical protein
VVSGAAVLAPDLRECPCSDCYEAHIAANNAARVSALRAAAIRAYQRGQKDFAVGFVEEVLPGWDQ